MSIEDFLKKLPIWKACEVLNVNIENLKYDMKVLSARADKLEKEFGIESQPSTSKSGATENKLPDRDPFGLDKAGSSDLKPGESIVVDSEKNSLILLSSPFTLGEIVYAEFEPGQPWKKSKILKIFRRPHGSGTRVGIRVRTVEESNARSQEVLDRDIARVQSHLKYLKTSKRVIAGDDESHLMPGIIGQEPSQPSNFRYLVLFDDSSARYFEPSKIYPIFGQSAYPWKDIKYINEDSLRTRCCVRYFMSNYPKRQLLQASVGQRLDVLRNGVWETSSVISFDCDTITVEYDDKVREQVYGGSPRLIKRAQLISTLLRSRDDIEHFYYGLLLMLLEYSRVAERTFGRDYHKFDRGGKRDKVILGPNPNRARRHTDPPKKFKADLGGQNVVEDRTIEHLDQARVKEMKTHKCNPSCKIINGVKTESSIKSYEALIDEFRNESDLKVPLLLGWKRSLKRIPWHNKTKVIVVYEAPCGKIFQQSHSIRTYLERTNSLFDIDYFCFDKEIVLNDSDRYADACYFVANIAKDKNGVPLENKFISVLNTFDEEELPIDYEYYNITVPHPRLVSQNFTFNEDFKSYCDCLNDCFQKSTCDCHRLNEDCFTAQNRRQYNRGGSSNKCQYTHKRLPTQVNTGIFECNSKCTCSRKCPNRVVQNGLRFRLQIRKTALKGWGVVTLDSIPSGAFICTYAAELLDDADQYGDSDMYYADLDYVTVLERQKLGEDSDEGVDAGDSDADKEKVETKTVAIGTRDASSSSSSSSSPSSVQHLTDNESQDSADSNVARTRYPKRRLPVKEKPVSQPKVTKNDPKTQFKKIHDILNSNEFTLDARVRGNVGRFFNHSCDPNATVQNVFIETHDLRFPVVAFFSIKYIRAGSEITWNYNYKMGSIPGREMMCHCSASNCRGRIL